MPAVWIAAEMLVTKKKQGTFGELLPVKRTEKKYIIFPASNQPLLGVCPKFCVNTEMRCK